MTSLLRGVLRSADAATLATGTLGFEWDEDVDNGARPAGLVRLSSTTVPLDGNYSLLDEGATYGPGTGVHALTLYRYPPHAVGSGALVFGAGTPRWTWGLDSHHDSETSVSDIRMQQATVNLFADMGVQPATLQANLVAATPSTDTTLYWSLVTSNG